MSSVLQAAARIEDLLRIDDAQVPYRFDRIFAGKGLRARWLARRRLALLKQVEADLERMLEPGERVELVSWGIEYAFVEAWFLGLWHQLINRRALLLTDRRLVMIQIDSRRRVRELRFAIPYAAIRRLGRGGLGPLRLVLRSGERVALTGVPGPDRKAVRAFVAERARRSATAGHAGQGRQNLCPHCMASVAGRPERCPRCQGRFKSAARAGRLSLLLPGLGDLYLGHRALGVVELGGALLLWGIALPVLVGTWQESGHATADAVGLAAGAFLLFALGHGSDAWITRRVARKGLYPAR